MSFQRRLRLVAFLGLVSLHGVGACAASRTDQSAERFVPWPRFGPPRPGPTLDGHTNTVPDVVGPVDGSARLTILTEGNHFPVLLPLVFEAFPAYCDAHPACELRPEDILVITLPQYMVEAALADGGLRFGNLFVPLRDEPGAVWPDIVMAGKAPLARLAGASLILPSAKVLARHRGLSLLVHQQRASRVRSLADLAEGEHSLIYATPTEAGARGQYEQAVSSLLGPQASASLFEHEVPFFPGRLAIQHRDVPYALLSRRADVGLLFHHLAAYWSRVYPNELVFRTVPGAERWGQEILVARTRRGRDASSTQLFLDFLLERAPDAYRNGGFAEASSFDFAENVDLLAPDE